MYQITVLKEQAMMSQAERRLMENKENQQQQIMGHNQIGQGPWNGTAPGPSMRPMGPPMQNPHLMAGPPPPFGADGPRMDLFRMPPPPPQVPMGPGGFMNPNSNLDLPLASEEDLQFVQSDTTKTCSIYNQPREIRFYDETATCVMDESDVRELTFERPSGDDEAAAALRRVLIDGDASVVPPLEIGGAEYAEFTLDGAQHRIKLGAPTREVWLDGRWYECRFGDKAGQYGNEIRVQLGHANRSLRLEGPKPAVRPLWKSPRRPDLCAGFVSLVHNGRLPEWRKLYLVSRNTGVVWGYKIKLSSTLCIDRNIN